MIKDKEKFRQVFEETNAAALMFKIAKNFEDKESIVKVFKLLSENFNEDNEQLQY